MANIYFDFDKFFSWTVPQQIDYLYHWVQNLDQITIDTTMWTEMLEALRKELLEYEAQQANVDKAQDETTAAHYKEMQDAITSLASDIAKKQNILSPGENIQITGDVISATDTTYTAGDNVQISGENVISVPTSSTITPAGTEPVNSLAVNFHISKILADLRTEDIDPMKEQIAELETSKQDMLTAGNNITIDGNVISAADTKYTAGSNIQISDDNVISAEIPEPEYDDTVTPDSENAPTSKAVADYVDGLVGGLSDSMDNVKADLTAAQGDINSLSADKQDKLTAGDNIQISEDNVISATDTKYTAGRNIQISDDNVISATGGGEIPAYDDTVTPESTNAPTSKAVTEYVEGQLGPEREQIATLTQDISDTAADVSALEADKQDKLTAGENIQISEDNVISSTDTKYTAGSNIQISDDNVISADGGEYSAGNGIMITGYEISVNSGNGLLFDNNGKLRVNAVDPLTNFPTNGVSGVVDFQSFYTTFKKRDISCFESAMLENVDRSHSVNLTLPTVQANPPLNVGIVNCMDMRYPFNAPMDQTDGMILYVRIRDAISGYTVLPLGAVVWSNESGGVVARGPASQDSTIINYSQTSNGFQVIYHMRPVSGYSGDLGAVVVSFYYTLVPIKTLTS